jgi:hypothetical protein
MYRKERSEIFMYVQMHFVVPNVETNPGQQSVRQEFFVPWNTLQLQYFCCGSNEVKKTVNSVLKHQPLFSVLSVPREPGSSVGTVSGYGLDGRGSIPDRGRGFFLSPLRPDRL